MFGKKKTNAAPAAAAPSANIKTKGKGKSSKGNRRVTAKSGPNFLLAHAEKLVLATIVGFVGFLMYRSLSLETLPASRNPETLQRQSQDLLNKVSQESHWEEILPERQQYTRHQFHQNAKASRIPAQPSLYSIGKLDPPTVRELYAKRTDPAIFAPEQLHVQNVFAALAVSERVNDPNAKTPFDKYDDADPIGRKPTRDRPTRDKDEQPTSGGPTSIRRLPPRYDLGAPFGGTMGGAGGSIDGLSGSLGGPMRGSDFDPQSGGSRKLGQSSGPSYRLASRPVIFNAITALVPHRKMAQEYFDAFANTGTLLSERDTPRYLNVEVQRVDVTGSPYLEIKEDQWKTILTLREIARLPLDLNWATHWPEESRLTSPMPEVIDPRAYIPDITAPIPPILVRDYRQFSKHPKIDWYWNSQTERVRNRIKKPKTTSDDEEVIAGTGRTGGAPGIGGSAMGGSGLSRLDSLPINRPPDLGDSGMGGMGNFNMSGSASTGAWGSIGDTPELEPEYKMVRVFDFLKAQDRGRTFRYRMRLTMRDPNYPENQLEIPAPRPEELDHTVLERVHKLQLAEDKVVDESIKQGKLRLRTRLLTDWSQPSDPVVVTQTTEAFVGELDPAKGAKIVAGQLVGDPPGAVLTADIEGAQRGNVLGSPLAHRDFIVPTTKVIKRVEQSVLPGLVLVDMRGGTPLAGARRDDPLTSTSEVMILRPDGSVQFSNSYDDQLLYRMYTYQDEKEAAKTSPSASSDSGR
ncbi:MAG: hypothetical protein KF752_08750 [Pirellulaceae bacterium]|nr:hypothetical protein [Pirellulaceae bacterium]